MSITSTVPFFLASAMPSSSMKLACSMESTPASNALRMPVAPCACEATLRPSACASSTSAFSSSSEYCGAPTSVPLDSTPPVEQVLMKSAPNFTSCRTFCRTAQGPSATPSPTALYSAGSRLLSLQWPPVMPMATPPARMRGPSTSPFAMASRSATSA